jgi:DHA1 family multidrug resistance protein-like MFS transporter
LSSIFAIQCATAQNLATIIIGRFLSGLFASAPYAIGGGCFHDFLDPIHVQGGIAFFATATAGGPALGPILGAGLATTSSTYGWRWSGWFLTASGVLITILLVVFMDESYSPAVLSNIAKERRKTTGEDGWWSELDLVSVTPRIILVQYILRPVKMLMVEPSEVSSSYPTRDDIKHR